MEESAVALAKVDIHDPAEIKKIMASLNIAPYRAPPKLKPFPEQLGFDLLVDDIPDYDLFDEQ